MKQYKKSNYNPSIFFNIQKTFDEYLNVYPKDTDVWLSYALCMYKLAEGEDLAENCLKKIYEYDKSNVYATMLHAYIAAHDSHIDDELFEKLCNVKTHNLELQSMIEYLKSYYYFLKNDTLNEKVLQNSVALCDKHVWNLVNLGRIYIKKGDYKEGQRLIKKALSNIEYTYDEHPIEDQLDLNEYFNETIKGIHLTDSNYNSIIDSLDPDYLKPIMDLINKHMNLPKDEF